MSDDLHILAEDCVFAFCPAYEPSDDPQPIRIVFDGMPGFITTTLVALTLDDAERLCTRLNRPARPRPRRLVGHRRALHARRGRRVPALTPGPRPAPRRLGVDTVAGPKSIDAPCAPRDPCLRAAPGRPGHPRAGQRGDADRRGGPLPMRGQAAVNLSRQHATQESNEHHDHSRSPPRADSRPARATYQDVLDAPPIASPKSSRGSSTLIRDPRCPMHWRARCWVEESAIPTMTRLVVPADGGSSTNGAAPWRRHPGSGPRRMAP